jgi:hypothetical protein
VRVFGVQFAVEAPAQRLVLTGGAEGLAAKCRRLTLLDDDAHDAGVNACAANQDGGSKSNLLHGGFSFPTFSSVWIG